MVHVVLHDEKTLMFPKNKNVDINNITTSFFVSNVYVNLSFKRFLKINLK